MTEPMPVAGVPGLHKLVIPTPFRIGPVNVYLDDGDPPTLVDVGPATDEAWDALLTGLALAGRRAEDIGRVIITHHHVDHYGLAQRLASLSGAEVISHPLAVPWLADPAARRTRHQPFWDNLFAESGVPEEIQASIRQVTRYTDGFGRPVDVARTIDEGDIVELAGLAWQVLHTPGHAGSLICLYQPETRTLLSNDHLLRDVSSNPIVEAPPAPGTPRPHRLLDYMEQLQRVAELDVRVALPGHGADVVDHRSLIAHRLKYHRARADRILRFLGNGPLHLYDLVQLLFPGLDSMNVFLALSEILGHLDWLEEEGQVRPEHSGGEVLWRVRQIPA